MSTAGYVVLPSGDIYPVHWLDISKPGILICSHANSSAVAVFELVQGKPAWGADSQPLHQVSLFGTIEQAQCSRDIWFPGYGEKVRRAMRANRIAIVGITLFCLGLVAWAVWMEGLI